MILLQVFFIIIFHKDQCWIKFILIAHLFSICNKDDRLEIVFCFLYLKSLQNLNNLF